MTPASAPLAYTRHEHLEELALIHMNARVYDPTTARFMSADPVLQNPYNLQSRNRYSYVMNNPLAWHHHGIRTGRFNW